jgi:hypothetical protein
MISGFSAKKTRTALFWVIMQQVVVISYRHFGTTYWSHLQNSKFLALVYPEERSSQNRWLFQVIKEGSHNFVCSYRPVL